MRDNVCSGTGLTRCYSCSYLKTVGEVFFSSGVDLLFFVFAPHPRFLGTACENGVEHFFRERTRSTTEVALFLYFFF